jgi:outer membrane protein OmpA-like peptidoglycan-associated protein
MKSTRMSKAACRSALGALVWLSGCQPPPKLAVLPAAVETFPAPTALAPAPAYTERRILLSVQFGFDKSSINPESMQTLNNLAAAMKDQRLRGVSYEINGHTDLGGNFAHNIALSAMRATAVSHFLRDSGVQFPPIRSQGFGPLQLLYPAQPFRPENRRVEIVATGP